MSLELEKISFNFKNVFENACKAVEEHERVKFIISDRDTRQLTKQELTELTTLIEQLKKRLTFLRHPKSVRLLKRRLLSKQKRSNSIRNFEKDELIDFKINEFFQTEQLFGSFKKFDQNIEEQIREDEVVFSSTLASVNSSLFELKQLKDFSSCLLKLVNLRSRQRNEASSKISVRLLNEIFRDINEKKVEDERLKSCLKETLNSTNKISNYKALPNRKIFFSTLSRVEKTVRENLFGKGNQKEFIESQYSIENLVAIRHEWDKFLIQSNDRQKSVPLHWVEPNQTPNEEWSKFSKSE